MTIRLFDLNIEEVLENWDVPHALREIIANALDEQFLSGSPEIQIQQEADGAWHIRDFGRGLRIEHFTLNENQEKLQATTGIIGKFGVGLKDALATFHRHSAEVEIRSRYGIYTLRSAQKHGFDAITTLHVEYDDTPLDMTGTDVALWGVSDADIASAKSLFLKFAGEAILDSTPYGEILRRNGRTSRIYITGVFAAEEPNFLFSYNITSLTDSMKKRLNRERLNVGRTTYADRVKAILKGVTSPTVQDILVAQVARRASGDQADEMSWIEISQLALNLMHQRVQVAYVTEEELLQHPSIVDNMRSEGYNVVVITEQQKARLEDQMIGGGPQVRILETFVQEYNDSFEYQLVDTNRLTTSERRVLDQTPAILRLLHMSQNAVPRVLISETMRITNDATDGIWDDQLGAIVIKRSCLATLATYAGTLLHEVGHATTGAQDATRYFEEVLTRYLRQAADAALTQTRPFWRR